MCGGPRPSLRGDPALHLLISPQLTTEVSQWKGNYQGPADESGGPNGPKGPLAFKLSVIYLHKRRGSARRLF